MKNKKKELKIGTTVYSYKDQKERVKVQALKERKDVSVLYWEAMETYLKKVKG